jgi:uncharacterized protein YciI
MSHYAVIREAGPGWTDGGIADQPDVAAHAAFMNRLADAGLVLFAGPLAGSEKARLRALLIVDMDSEDDIRHRLAADPWVRTDRMVITSIEPWTLIVGAERLAALGEVTLGRATRTIATADRSRRRSTIAIGAKHPRPRGCAQIGP